MSVIFNPLGDELRLTVSCALTEPSVALKRGPNIAVAAALRSIARRLSIALRAFFSNVIFSSSPRFQVRVRLQKWPYLASQNIRMRFPVRPGSLR
jgi:hypothetical protein